MPRKVRDPCLNNIKLIKAVPLSPRNIKMKANQEEENRVQRQAKLDDIDLQHHEQLVGWWLSLSSINIFYLYTRCWRGLLRQCRSRREANQKVSLPRDQ